MIDCEAAQCGKFWLIERSLDLNSGRCREIEALVFAFELLPIWTHTYQEAMRLAEYCDPIPREPVAGKWVKVCAVHLVDGLFVCTR
jgi:hypothetical protein